jgi:hypothetical protein
VDNTPTSPTYGRVYVAWIADDVGSQDPHVELSWSEQNCTWCNRVHVDHSGSITVFAPYVAVDPAGHVGVIWYDYGADQIRVAFANALVGTSRKPQFTTGPTMLGSPGMQSIHAPITAQPDNGINPDPSLLVDDNRTSPFAGRMYAMWTTFGTNMPGAGVSNVVVRTSTDGGSTWGGVVKVNDDNNDPTQWGSGNFFGQQAIDETTGVLHVSFYSTRLDTLCKGGTFCQGVGCIGSGPCPGPEPPLTPCPMNCMTDVFDTQSTDGGQSFLPNQRVTDTSSDESANNSYRCQNCFQYGDYESIAVQNGIEHPVWTDARFVDGSSTLHEEVFTASIP